MTKPNTRQPDNRPTNSLRLIPGSHAVSMNGKLIALTGQEYELLRELMKTPHETVSREALLRNAWGYQSIGQTRTVDVHVQRLRRKLGMSAIETVYRSGYRLALG